MGLVWIDSSLLYDLIKMWATEVGYAGYINDKHEEMKIAFRYSVCFKFSEYRLLYIPTLSLLTSGLSTSYLNMTLQNAFIPLTEVT